MNPIGKLLSLPCFIPRRDSAKAEPVWGPFDSLYLWSKEGCLTLSIYGRKFTFLKSGNVLVPDGWMDRWGWDGRKIKSVINFSSHYLCI